MMIGLTAINQKSVAQEAIDQMMIGIIVIGQSTWLSFQPRMLSS